VSADDRHPGQDGCGANAAPYVLGALSDEESGAFRRHLQSCAICREEVASLRVVAAALPAAAPQLTAPSELKRRVMAAVRDDAARMPALRPGRALRRSSSRGRVPRAALAGLAAAAVVTAIVLLALPSGGGVRVIRAEVLAPHASAVVRVSGARAQLSVAGMPQPSPGRVYEIWVKGTGAPRPANALFTVSSAGDASVRLPRSVAGVREILVTSEPLGGSRAPTRAPVIVGRLG
jgi:anti-sigma-K factor RskA